MKIFLTMTCMVVLAIMPAGAAEPAGATPPTAPAADQGPVKAGDMTLESNLDKASYAIGVDIARNFKRAQVDLNLKALEQGFQDVAADTPAMTDEQMAAVMTEFQQTMMAKMQEVMEKEAAESKVKGDEFLAEKAKEPGVKKTDSGLLYQVIEEGTGKAPTASDTVRVDYTGTLIDGKKFDSSVDRGQPATFKVGQVIKGWQEALQLMKEGGHWKLYIPGDLAYGPNGNPRGGIPGNAVLIFDVQLLEVVNAPAGQVTIPNTNPHAQ